MSNIEEIQAELQRARAKHPAWPADIIHAVAIMCEESGEALRAALNAEYHGESISLVREEVIQTAAMCLRLLDETLDNGE